MTMVYEWSSSRSFPVDPTKAGQEIERIAKRSPGGAALSTDIVEASRAKSAVLHDIIFAESDQDAAEMRRREIAREITRNLVVVKANGKTTKTPAFYHVNYETVDGERVRGFQPIEQVVKDPEARQSAAERLIRELEGLQRRFDELGEFQVVWQAVEKARRAVERKAA